MKMRNWLGLGRKLVDQYDMDASFQWVQQMLGYLTLSYWGFGVQKTTQFPVPFPITLAAGDLTGQVGPGIAFNPDGQLIQVLPDSPTSRAFTLSPSDGALDRWDLLCVRYRQGQDTQIQKPSNPQLQVYLNLNDDFDIVVRMGALSASPAYPAKQPGDVILAGLRVPAGAVSGSDVFVDLAVRELAQAAASLVPAIRQEPLAGAVDGVNRSFSLSLPPIAPKSVIVFVNSLALAVSDYLVSGQTVTMNEPPSEGQVVTAYYVANGAGSENPLAGFQEVPTGDVDGVNRNFDLEGLPADQRSTMVFVDGLQAATADWALVQGGSHGSILFAPAATPQPGQSVSVFYFVNPGTIGVGPAGQSSGGGSSGSGGGAPQVEYPVLTSADVAAGFVNLLSLPANPATVLLDVIGGSAQQYGADFTVSGQRLTFSGTLGAGGDTPLAAGDRLRIVYWN